MIIFGICLMALCIGSAVGYVATTRGRSFVPWAIYGTVLGPVALPHLLLSRNLSAEQVWSPIRFGLPSGHRTCPYCEAPVHDDAIACRRCRRPFYGAGGDAHGFVGMRDAQESGIDENLPEVTGAFAALERAIEKRHASAAAAERRRENPRNQEMSDTGEAQPRQPETPRQQQAGADTDEPHRSTMRGRPRPEEPAAPVAEPDGPVPDSTGVPEAAGDGADERVEPSFEDDWPLEDEKTPGRSEPMPASSAEPARRRAGRAPAGRQSPQFVQFRIAPAAQPRRNITVAEDREHAPGPERPKEPAGRSRSRWTPIGVASSPAVDAGRDSQPTPDGGAPGNATPTGEAASAAGRAMPLSAPRRQQLRADPIGGDRRQARAGRGVAVFVTAIAAGILLAVLVGAVTLWTNPQIMPVMASIPFVDVPPGAAEPEPAPENRQEWSPGYGDRPGDVVESGDRQQTEAMGRPIEIAPRFLSEAGRDSGPSASPIAPPPAPAPASEQSEDAAVASIAPTADSPTPDAPPVRLARRLPNAAGPAQSTAVNPARPDSGASSPAPAAASPQPETRPAPAQAVAKPQQEDLIARVIAALNERANARAAAESVAQGRPVTEVTASGDLIATVQRELQARGLEPGPVDGKVGPRTREAVRAFQQRMGIEPTGDIDRPTLVQLGLL